MYKCLSPVPGSPSGTTSTGSHSTGTTHDLNRRSIDLRRCLTFSQSHCNILIIFKINQITKQIFCIEEKVELKTSKSENIKNTKK